MSSNSVLQSITENDNVTYHTSKGKQPIVRATGYSKEVLLKYLNSLANGETHFLNTGEKQTLDELFKSVPK
jgi:hypothetical protein